MALSSLSRGSVDLRSLVPTNFSWVGKRVNVFWHAEEKYCLGFVTRATYNTCYTKYQDDPMSEYRSNWQDIYLAPDLALDMPGSLHWELCSKEVQQISSALLLQSKANSSVKRVIVPGDNVSVKEPGKAHNYVMVVTGMKQR